MGSALVIIGLILLVGGLVISLLEAWSKWVKPKGEDRIDASPAGSLEAIQKILEAFAKFTMGVQLSLIGLVLVYWGLLILEMLPCT
jgi:hypothetical protein